jgi:hypothetical protein
MSAINWGGPAFPVADLMRSDGMSLRDWFAACIDKDEYGDLVYRHMSLAAQEMLVGLPQPAEPKSAADRAKWQISKMQWEMRVRAAIRYELADAMLAARAVKP